MLTAQEEVREIISKQLEALFGEHFKGKAFACTYEGDVIGIDRNEIDLFKKLPFIKQADNKKTFIYTIGTVNKI